MTEPEADFLTPERFHAPLYDVPDDETHFELRDFTVTVAGPERWDGERPFTYVVRAHSTAQAWAQALAWHVQTNETLDAYVVAAMSHGGPPPSSAGYRWNDLRGIADFPAVVERAREMAEQFDLAVTRFRPPDGDFDPKKYARYSQVRAAFGEAAPELIQYIATDAVEAVEEKTADCGRHRNGRGVEP
jgi:hypothetical protein